MKIIHKEFPKIFKDLNSTKKDLIIIGGGRWAQIILNEVLTNFNKIKKIYIVTNNNKVLDNFSNLQKKKIFLKKNLNFIQNSNVKFAIIANKNEKHFYVTKKLLKKKINILVEKPLVENVDDFYKLKKLSNNKSKIFVSSPFFFSYYFYYFKKNFLGKDNFKINIQWHDKINENRNGVIKKHDFKINYLNDTIYHLFGILACFFGKKEIKFIKKINYKNYGKIFLKINENKIYLNCSRLKNNKRIRKISFISNKNIFHLNFSDDNNIKLNLNGAKKELNFKFCQKTLKFQLYYFLNYKKFSNYFIFNELKNLNNLFTVISKL